MEFLHIGESKLKIVMSAEELKEYGISPKDEGTTLTCRRAVWEILDRAKSVCGFNPNGDKILVQFYPMRDGGCELFVTKLGILAPSSARLVAKSERVALLSRSEVYYVFSSFDDVRSAVFAVMKSFS